MLTLFRKINFDNSIFTTIIVFLGSFPFINYPGFLLGTSTRFVNLILVSILLSIVLFVCLLKKKSSFIIPKSPIFIFLFSYFIFLISADLLGVDFSRSFWSSFTRGTGLWYLFYLGLFIYFLWLSIRDYNRCNLLILVVIITTSLYSILNLFSPNGLGLIFKNYTSEAFTFGNSSFAAMYIFGAFILSLYFLYQSENKKIWMYLLPISIVINPNIINRKVWSGDFSYGLVGDARNTAYVIILSILLLIFFWFLSKIKDGRKLRIVAYSTFVLFLTTMVIGSYSLLSPSGFLRDVYTDSFKEARPLVWNISEKAISQRPFFGWGSGNFERAFEENYDNRLLQEDYNNEAWFDRSHNIFIDKLVDNGYVGLIFFALLYLSIIAALIYTILFSIERKDRILAVFLITYFSLHILELQTSFETTISYPMLAIMIVLLILILDRTILVKIERPSHFELSGILKNIMMLFLIATSILSIYFGVIPYLKAQVANRYIYTVGTSEERISSYPIVFGIPMDTHSLLWVSFNNLKKGISNEPNILNDPVKVEGFKKEVLFIENSFTSYITDNPSSIRAKLNLADIQIYQSLLGVNRLNDAQVLLDSVIISTSDMPQPYWMKAVGYLYAKDFGKAKEYAYKALSLNKNAKQSQELVQYIETSIKNFPEIDFYFFKQI